MVKATFFDVYKRSNARIAKDTAGGYGTENLFGSGPVGFFAEKIIKKSVYWPSLTFAQLYTELLELPDLEVSFSVFEWTGDLPSVEVSDIFFICNSIVCFETEVECARQIKQRFPEATVILAGTPAMHLQPKIPEDIRIVAGNYDFLVQQMKVKNGDEFLASLNRNFQKTNIIDIGGGDPDLLHDIDWSDEFSQSSRNLLVNGGVSIPYLASRGCPYSCFEYCTYPTAQGRKVLAEDVKVTVDRLKRIAKKLPGAHIIFRDPVFSIDLKRSKSLLSAIGDANIGLSYTAEIHLKNVDEEFASLAQVAGFRWLKFGIESAHDDVRKNVKRHSEDNDAQFKKIKLLQKHGLRANGMFILCLPSDTWKTCWQTVKYAGSLGLDFAQFSIFTPYPGTPFFEFAKQKINAAQYQSFSQFELIFHHKHITKAGAGALLQIAYLYFFIPKLFKNPIAVLRRFYSKSF